MRIEKPTAGAYIVTVRAASVNGSFGAQPYALVATSKQNFGTGSSVDLGQPNAGALSGVVFADLDRDGVRDQGEPGLAGATAVVRQVSGALNRQATTDAAGAYQFTGLPAGDYSSPSSCPAPSPPRPPPP
ncbi:MAG: SdrD B-like domain-containing protein [Caldilineaceae bacterium]